jgi:hypothetical protein
MRVARGDAVLYHQVQRRTALLTLRDALIHWP